MGKDLKDGSIEKVELAPKVPQEVGVPGPVGPSAPSARRPPGPQGLPGSNATADGSAVVLGRVTDPDAQTGCIVGVPSGLTVSPGRTGVDLSMPLPAAKVIRRRSSSSTRPERSTVTRR